MTIAQFRNANADPDTDVVGALEDALALARSGELRSVSLVGDLTGGRTYTDFSTEDTQRLAGSLTFLLHTICAKQRENVE